MTTASTPEGLNPEACLADAVLIAALAEKASGAPASLTEEDRRLLGLVRKNVDAHLSELAKKRYANELYAAKESLAEGYRKLAKNELTEEDLVDRCKGTWAGLGMEQSDEAIACLTRHPEQLIAYLQEHDLADDKVNGPIEAAAFNLGRALEVSKSTVQRFHYARANLGVDLANVLDSLLRRGFGMPDEEVAAFVTRFKIARQKQDFRWHALAAHNRAVEDHLAQRRDLT